MKVGNKNIKIGNIYRIIFENTEIEDLNNNINVQNGELNYYD